MHKLIIEDDEGKTVVVPLIRDEITVGRQEGNTVRLTEQNISRRHARFIKEGGVLFVEDLSSYNGIKVNGTLIGAKTGLKDGDQILIGDYKLGLKADEAKTLGYGSARPRVASEPPPTAPQPMAPAPSAPVSSSSAAPSDVIEGAPTIPVRTLADQGLLSGGPQLATSRLVVVSTQLAGAEFVLDRASLVIGRTAENDIILNHKSISRHHAKVIRDGEKYVVVDLESANGVRVNGTQQERMVLDSGDVIELGHVRLKYLVGDDVLGAAGLASLRGSKKPLIIGGAVAAALVLVLVFAFAGGSKKTTAPEAVATNTATPPPAEPVPTPPPAPATPPVAATPEPPAPPATGPSIEPVKALVDQGKWDQAIAALDQLPPEIANGAEGKALRRQVAVDRSVEATLGRLQVEAEAGRVEPSKKLAAAIPADSRYAPQAAELLTKVQNTFVETRMKVATAHKTAGRCDEARKEAERILKQVPGAAAPTALIADCKAAPAQEPVVAAVAPKRAPKPAAAEAPAPVARPKPEPKEEEEPAAAGDPDQFIKDAQDAWLHGQFAAAIVASKKALRLRPGMARAYQIIAVCSCSLRDQAAAAKAYDKLDDKNRQMVRTLCERNGIALPE